MPKVLVFNGWAAGSETWELTSFRRDWTFSYIEEMDGLPARVMREVVGDGGALLVGFSMGGTMALQTWLEFPEKVRGLVLVSATPRMMEDRESGWKGMSLRRRAALRFGTVTVFGNDPSPVYAEKNLDRGLDFLQKTDLRPRLEARGPSELPVAILQSERDGIVRPDNAEYLKRVFPRATVTMVPGGEHVLPVTVPGLVDAAVRDLLGGC